MGDHGWLRWSRPNTRVWRDAAKAALDANVQNLVLNFERAWKRRPAGLARRVLAALHNAVPRITLGHTTYDAPVRALWQANPPLYFGGQSPYPTREFLGTDSRVKWTIPQIYWATRMTPSTSRGPGIRRLAKHRASFALAKRQGVIRSDMRVDAYLQTYGCRVDELCFVATQFESASWWVAKPGHLRDAGATAIRALCELERRGFRGSSAISDAQRALGVPVDGWVGKSTLEALLPNTL